MKHLYYSTLAFILISENIYANRISTGIDPDNALIDNTGWGLIEVLSFIEWILLRVVLPLVIIGSALYIAYELFTADGSEERLKKAWKSVTFASIGIVSIAFAYAIVSLASRLSL
jgi:hypothetical protein